MIIIQQDSSVGIAGVARCVPITACGTELRLSVGPSKIASDLLNGIHVTGRDAFRRDWTVSYKYRPLRRDNMMSQPCHDHRSFCS